MDNTVNEKLHELAEMVRAQVRSQVAFWQQIPHWSLEAQGRTGWLDSGPWHEGYVELGNRIRIDCATGEIVSRGKLPIHDAAIIGLLENPKHLDPFERLKEYQEHASKPRPSYYSAEEWARAEITRASLRHRYHVTLPYKREASAA